MMQWEIALDYIENSTITTDYQYDACDRLLQAGNIRYLWDKNGNLISKIDESGTTTYHWDYENRLIKTTYPDNSSSTYVYSPLGKRISKTDKSGSVTVYLYDGDNILAEYDESQQLKNKFTVGLGIDEF
jgi:YD repeat-containing protein